MALTNEQLELYNKYNLINRINGIDTVSPEFFEEQLKRKDLTKDETALANRAKNLQIKVHEKTLAGPSLTEAYNAYFEKHGSYPSGDSLANLARTKGVEIESVVDTKSVNSWLKNNKGKDEVDFMEVEVKKAKEDNTPITPGVYVVTDRIIIVGVDGKVKSSL